MIVMKWIHSDARHIRKRMGIFHLDWRKHHAGVIRCMILVFSLAVFPVSMTRAQEKNVPSAQSNQDTPQMSPKLNYAGVSFKPSNQRDPFLNPLFRAKGSNGDQEIDRGLPPPGIAGTFIAEAVLKGVSIRENSNLAIIKGSGNRAYFLRVGDRLFDGYLKAIHRDSITLVRETKMRSGKIIAQEVTKRLRTP